MTSSARSARKSRLTLLANRSVGAGTTEFCHREQEGEETVETHCSAASGAVADALIRTMIAHPEGRLKVRTVGWLG